MTMPTSFASPPPSPLLARFSSVSDSDRSSRRLSSMPLKMADVANILLKMRRHRARSQQQHIESSSGDWPITHPGLASDGTLSPCRVPLEQNDTFVCRDGVDVVKLLRLVRATLYEVAQSLGANVLVDEQWSCRICLPRHESRSFKVHVRYTANAARSDKPDPQQPVALDCARGVPGLMTILDRLD